MAENRMRMLLGLAAIMIAVWSCGRDVLAGSTGAFDPQAVLQKAFGDRLDFSVTRKRYRISYCPDNTCDIIEMPQKVGHRVMTDFVYLHTMYLNDYAVDAVSEFKERQSSQTVRSILDRYAGACDRSEKYERCVIETMMKIYKIDLRFSRFDEGATHEGPYTPPELKMVLDRIENLEKR